MTAKDMLTYHFRIERALFFLHLFGIFRHKATQDIVELSSGQVDIFRLEREGFAIGLDVRLPDEPGVPKHVIGLARCLC